MITTILPTDECNLNCSYCVSRKGHNRMSKKTMYNALDFSAHIHDTVDETGGHIEWHAAEPMMMPIQFYVDAEKHLDNIGCKINRVMCSNMTLANDDWYDFFEKYNYNVSTSLDGDVFLHDHNMGIGTFDKIIHSISEMKKRNIDYGCIAVISRNTCLHSKEVYPFFRIIEEHIKLNVETPNNFNIESLECFIQIFDDWYSDPNKIHMDPFNSMVNFIEGEQFEKRCYANCNKFVVCIDTFGDVYPCESFVIDDDTSEYILGNVNEQTWDEIWNGDKRKAFLKNQAVLSDECFCCRYLEYCGGGCNADSMLYGPADTRKASCCEVIKPLMDHIASRIGVS